MFNYSPEVAVAADGAAAAVAKEGAAVGAHHLVAALRLGDGHLARQALPRRAEHLLHLCAAPVLGALPLPFPPPLFHFQQQLLHLILGGHAVSPEVAPLPAPRAEGEEARGALHVVARQHACRIAPRAVGHIGHRVQCRQQRQRLSPRVQALVGDEQVPQHVWRQRGAARRLRARQPRHAAFLHVDVAVGLHALDAEGVAARELDEVPAYIQRLMKHVLHQWIHQFKIERTDDLLTCIFA